MSLGKCGGTYISDQGHILTALHCIDSAPIFDQVELKTFDTYLLRVDPEKMKSHPMAKVRIGAPLLPADGDTRVETAEVIAAGKGYFQNLNHLKAGFADFDRYSQLMNEGYGPPQDWVIIKANRSSSSCRPIRQDSLPAGEKVWSVQFQSRESYRPNDTRAKEYFSSGVITHGIEDNSAFQEWLQKATTDREVIEKLFRFGLNRPGEFWTTVDALPGVSGSGLFDLKGNLAGAINSVNWFGKNGNFDYVAGSTQGVIIETIIQSVRKQLSSEQFDAVFHCSDN